MVRLSVVRAFGFGLLIFPSILFAQDQLARNRAETLFKKGTELINHSNFGAAREVFADFLTNATPHDARRAEAEYYIAYSALQLGHSDGEKRIEDFIEDYPSNPKSVTAFYELANFFYNEKNYTKASSYYKRVEFQGLSPEQQTEGRFRWGYSLFSQKKLKEASEQFDYVKIQSSPYTPAANYYSGFIKYTEGDYETALVDLKRAESHESYANIVPILVANVLYKLRQYDELIQYHKGLENKSGSITNYDEISMLAADAFYFKRDYANAAKAYENYLEDNASKAPASLLFRAGYSYFSLKQDDQAIEYLKASATASDSVGYYASYYLGILYLKQGNKQYAFNAFEHARKYLADKELVEESTFQFAKVAYDVGNPDLAISEFEGFLQGFPSTEHSNEVKELLAQAYVNGNNYNKAIEYIEALPKRSLAVDRAFQKATYLKGTELYNKDDYAGAIGFFEKSISVPVDRNYMGLASFWCGESYSTLRKYTEAIPHYQKVVAMSSEAEPEVLTQTRYGLGYAHFNLQQYDQALFSFKEFVNKGNSSQTHYADGMTRLADCYYVSKSYPEALATYNRSRQLNSSDDDYILFQSGVINGILRKYAEARTQFNVLLSSYPKSQYREDALFQRAQFEIEQGNYQVAVDGLSQLIREGGGSRLLPYAYMRRAASYYNLKQFDKTVNDYVAVVQQFPTHPAAQQVLLPLQEALGLAGKGEDFDRYLAEYKQANPGNKDLEVVEFETAKNFYFAQQYPKAVSGFNSFLTAYPQSARQSEAQYYLAESYYRQQQWDKALPIYEQLIGDPSFTFGSRVIGRAAEIEFRQGRYEKAIVSYHKLERLATNKKELYNAWSGLMESFYLMAVYDSVNAYANLIIEKGNVNAGAVNKASLFIGKSAMARGDYDTAKDEFLNTLNSARDEYGAEAKYRLAEIFFTTQQYKPCYETLISLNTDFAAYDEWVGKSYLLLADYFLAVNDSFQAKATLESLIGKFPLQHIQETAKDKLKKIQEAEAAEKEKQMAADTLDDNR